MTGKTLDGKVALVTGASRGIGRAIALELADAHAQLILTARDRNALQNLAEQITSAGCYPPLVVPLDLTDETAIGDAVELIKNTTNQLDILVNNAGITLGKPLEQTATAEWDRLMAVNARAPFILCREFLDLLRRAAPSHIVNISSVVGVKGYSNQIAYTGSKHALRGMSIALAEELKSLNIRVHVICPGGVATDMVQQVRPDINTDELIQPQEIAELVRYLVTHQGNGIIDEIRIRRATSDPWF